MAVAASLLTSSITGTDNTSFTTASVAPTANSLVLACVWADEDGLVTHAAPTVSGAGMTWTQIDTLETNDSGVTLERLTVFRALSASPGSGALTISFGANNTNMCAWSIVQFSGVSSAGTNGSGAIRQYKFAVENPTTSAPSLAFDASTVAGNATFGCIGNSSGSRAITQGGSFTEISEVASTVGGNCTFETEFAASNINTVAWSVTAGDVALMASFELVGGQVLLPDADVAAGGWTTSPLFSKVNDSSDATIITATAS